MTLITTYLEMKSRGQLRGKACADPRFRVLEATVRQGAFNRFLYELVGGPWAWRDKLSWSAEQWQAHAEAENLRTFAAYFDGSPAGYFELRQDGGEVEILYFGLAPAFLGKGLGGPLLSCALEKAWELNPSRVWVHTCNLDHPAALPNYLARGMAVYRTEEKQG